MGRLALAPSSALLVPLMGWVAPSGMRFFFIYQCGWRLPPSRKPRCAKLWGAAFKPPLGISPAAKCWEAEDSTTYYDEQQHLLGWRGMQKSRQATCLRVQPNPSEAPAEHSKVPVLIAP